MNNFHKITTKDLSNVLDGKERKEGLKNYGIRSKHHKVYTYEETKNVFTAFDDKRVYDNEGNSFPHGHQVICIHCGEKELYLNILNKSHNCKKQKKITINNSSIENLTINSSSTDDITINNSPITNLVFNWLNFPLEKLMS